MSMLSFLSSLRARVALATVVAVALVVGIVGWFVVTNFAGSELDAVNSRLIDRAERISPTSGGSFDLPPPGVRVNDPVELALVQSGDVVRLIENGRVVGVRGDVEGAANLPVVTPIGLSYADVDGESWRVLTLQLPAVFGPVGVSRTLQVAAPLAPVEASVARLRGSVISLGLVALAIAAAAGWAFGGIALRSLRRLRVTATQVSSTRDLSTRVPTGEGSPTEVEELAASLNAMLERLQRSSAETLAALAATRRFTADAGHELRTPLTAMGANLETLRRNPDLAPEERSKILAETIQEQDRLTALLGSLQALARADAGAMMEREPVDVGEVADAAVEAARRRHPESLIELDDGEPMPIEAWPQGIRLLIDNLVENGVRHGRGRVELCLSRNGDEAVILEVADAGPGIPEAERQRVFGRFVRGAGAQGEGSGLGLALVQQQVLLHGGTIEIGEAAMGGALFTVTLPARSKPEVAAQ
jgi:signal transduction histidine kinase